jgi:ABC-type phosphate/phosphonate transport system substrate-binding protein
VTDISNNILVRFNTVLFLLLLLIVTACQSQSTQALTPITASSQTSDSAQLLTDSPNRPDEQFDHVLQIALRPTGSIDEAEAASSELASAIKEQVELTIEFLIVDEEAEALAALCNSTSDKLTAAWLDGIAYVAARSLNCGEAILEVERGQGGNRHAGEATSIIAREDLSIKKLSDLDGRRFCRIGYQDQSSWLVPTLLMSKDGLKIDAFKSVTDKDDTEALIQSVIDGDCDAAGIPANALDEMADQLGDDLEKISVVSTSPKIPYTVLVVPAEVPLTTQQALSSAMRNLV